MSTFEVKVCRVAIEEHPNADSLSLAVVGDYRSCVRKGQFASGDLVAYIPEDSIVTPWLQKELGVEGKLAGPKHNRVKAVRLRGILSQGLVMKARDYWVEGQDVAEELHIKKYEVPVPPALAGEVYNAGGRRTIKYDIENWKKFNKEILEGLNVVMTEKLHGTFCCFGVMPDSLQTVDGGHLVVSSKGLGSQGLALKGNTPKNTYNTYVKMGVDLDIVKRVRKVFDVEKVGPVFVIGEIFGQNIQDLNYGTKEKAQFRVFDIHVGCQGLTNSYYLSDIALSETCQAMGLERVPVLYRGPFDKDVMKKYTTGHETVSGKATHIREGVVIRPQLETFCASLPGNRLQLKSVSEDYLTRKGDTTEYT